MQRGEAERILIAAGGTGGHIVPGIALAKEFQKQEQIVFFLSLKKNQNYAELKEMETAALHFYDAPPLPKRKEGLSFLTFPWRFFLALCKAYFLLKKEKIDFLIAMGSYPVVPALLAALLLGRPYFLCEQNAIAGLTSRFFAKKARALFINFPLQRNLRGVDKKKIQHKGNPLRPQVIALCQKQSKSSQKKRTKPLHVLALGGSQGALQINRIVSQVVPQLCSGFQWKWTIQCGASHLQEMKERLGSSAYPHLELIAYRSSIAELYLEADILVCRAGAGVLSEALCFGLPLVLIPYPYAKDAHQEANANYLRQAGAALLCRQRDTKPDSLLRALKYLKENPQKRKLMGERALSLSLPHAARDIAQKIKDM